MKELLRGAPRWPDRCRSPRSRRARRSTMTARNCAGSRRASSMRHAAPAVSALGCRASERDRRWPPPDSLRVFERGMVGDEPRGGRSRLDDLDEVVRRQRPSGRGDVEHAVRETGQRRELHGPVQADHHDIQRARGEESARGHRILGRDAQRLRPHPSRQRRVARSREHQPAPTEPEVGELVALAAALPEDVLADDAAFAAAHLHVHGHIRRSHLHVTRHRRLECSAPCRTARDRVARRPQHSEGRMRSSNSVPPGSATRRPVHGMPRNERGDRGIDAAAARPDRGCDQRAPSALTRTSPSPPAARSHAQATPRRRRSRASSSASACASRLPADAQHAGVRAVRPLAGRCCHGSDRRGARTPSRGAAVPKRESSVSYRPPDPSAKPESTLNTSNVGPV